MPRKQKLRSEASAPTSAIEPVNGQPLKATKSSAPGVAQTSSSATKAVAAAKKRVSPAGKLTRPKAVRVSTSFFDGAEADRFRDAVSKLAYQFWEARGFPEGTADDDWVRAETAVRDVITKLS